MTTIALLLSSLLSKAATVLFGRLKSCLGVHVLFILKNTGTFWIPETDDDLASGVYVEADVVFTFVILLANCNEIAFNHV